MEGNNLLLAETLFIHRSKLSVFNCTIKIYINYEMLII